MNIGIQSERARVAPATPSKPKAAPSGEPAEVKAHTGSAAGVYPANRIKIVTDFWGAHRRKRIRIGWFDKDNVFRDAHPGIPIQSDEYTDAEKRLAEMVASKMNRTNTLTQGASNGHE